MKAVRIIFVVSIITLLNCAYQKLQALLDEPVSGRQIMLPVAVKQLTIQDARTAIENRDMKISAFAIPGRKDQIAPALSAEQRDLLEKEFGRYASNRPSDYSAACTVQIVEGIERYESSWSGEDMFARSKIRLVLIDSLHTPFLASAIGEAELSFKSNIANKKNFEKLYQKAMKTALFKAIESISGVVKSNFP